MKGRRFCAGLLIALNLCAWLAAAPALSEEEVQQPRDVYVMMGLETEASGRAWEQNAFFQHMQERTGIAFTFRQYDDAQAYQQAKDLAFASGDLPDVFFKGALTAREEMDYLQSGQLVDLTRLLPEYAPTLSTILEARPDWRAIVAQPDGRIATLPSLNGYERQAYIWINKTWLDTLGLAVPESLSDYEVALAAIKTGDPNGNGKRDELPLSMIGPWEARFFLHAFGLTPNDYHIYVDDQGAVQYAPLDPSYRAFLEWLARMLSEGLLDKDAFRQNHGSRDMLVSEETELTMGSFVTMVPFNGLVDLEQSLQYVVVPPFAYEGEQSYRRLLTGVARGTFAITSACKDPGELLNWVDFLYTEDGGRLALAGELDVDYQWREDGTWDLMTEDFFYTMDIQRDRVIRSGLNTPGLEPADFLRRTSIPAETHVRRQGDTITSALILPFPIYWPTDEAREAELAQLQYALGYYVDMQLARFATGEVPINDESWAEFQRTLQDMGVERFVSLWQSIYDETLGYGANTGE